ncbi:hypothetical protein [Propionivibrio limicola]|uniref:hypothetical protein n=1 Tax=Propionivibrio limicola TaxID=167645 RepID=UPI0012918617|nr:hypothetical protein [Propionivibrio limicola]
MITRINESEASALSAADVARYLEATGKLNVVYRSRSILEIGNVPIPRQTRGRVTWTATRSSSNTTSRSVAATAST